MILHDERTYIEVSVSALNHNINVYRAMGHKKIYAVMKADAYGHGIGILPYLEHIDGVCVATLEEGVRIREISDLPILILGYVPESSFDKLATYSLTPAVFSVDYAKKLNAFLTGRGLTYSAHLKINSGMNRVGVKYDDFSAFKSLVGLKNLHLKGIFSHFAAAGEDENFTALQTKRFFQAVEYLSGNGMKFETVHIQNSKSGLREVIGDAVRIGYGMYGYGDGRLLPALTWKARVVERNDIRTGETVGYSRSYIAKKPTVTATIAAGYGDGLPREYYKNGFVLYRGRKLPFVGKICMDMSMVDATGTDLTPGDYVTIIGKSGQNFLSAEDLGFGYEVLCGISKRVQRYYIS